MVLAASYWMSFEFGRDLRASRDDKTLARGAFTSFRSPRPISSRASANCDQLAKRYIA